MYGKKKRKSGMNKKVLIGIGIAVVIIALLVGIYVIYVYKPAIPAKEQLIERFSEFNTQYQEKKAQDYDVTEAEEFARKAKQAFDRKDYGAANKFLDDAFEALEKAVVPIVPVPKEVYAEMCKEEVVDSRFPEMSRDEFQDIIITKKDHVHLLVDEYEQHFISQKQQILDHWDDYFAGAPPELRGEYEDFVNNEIKPSFRDFAEDLEKDGDIDTLYDDYNNIRNVLIDDIYRIQRIRRYAKPEYDEMLQKYKPESYQPMLFIAVFLRPIATSDLSSLIKEVDFLSSVGVDAIRVNIFSEMLSNPETKAKLDAVISRIKENGKEVKLKTSGKQSWLDNPVSFEVYTEGVKSDIDKVMEMYHPDYISLSPEPYGFATRMIINGKNVPVNDWINAISELSAEAKRIDPEVKTEAVTVGTRGKQVELFDTLVCGDLPDLDIVAIQPYMLSGLKAAEGRFPIKCATDKEIIIGETWDMRLGYYYDELADEYIRISVYYAQTHNLSAYTLFFTGNLHDENYNPTPAFYAYKSVIEEVKSQSGD